MGGNGTVLEPTVSVDSPVGHAVDPERPANATLSMDLARGSSVGRYVILDHLGAGGMGVVYRAYDPDLHRRVAIKLLHPDSSGGTTGSARMLREAQAMAQLSHPNVITIHDVGSVDDHIYLAMELISGRTLTQWLRDTPRPWSEVVDVFLQAGRGLVAAHEKELVHRDFKPDNAMIDDAGRVRVMDFGLARTTGVRAPAGTALSDGLDGPTVPEPTPLNSELTREGALMGTPAYMAAEQFAGLPADARTDQFSFCVALWEGIHGARPFAGRGLAALGAAITAGKVVEPERLEIPAAIDRALRRGLSPDPDARWPTLQDLLDALAASARPKARRATAPIAVLLAGGVGLGTWIVTARDDR
ncbi:MAG: serine/threonine-protein kinase, partial [Myxococcota bacterium]